MTGGIKTCWTLMGLVILLSHGVMAQKEDWAFRQEPLETSIAARDWATRLRLEHVTTHDRDDLLTEDPAYRDVPNRIWAADARLIHRRRFMIGSWMEWWETEQDTDSRRYGWMALLPLRDSWTTRVRLVTWRQDHAKDRRFFYTGLSGLLHSAVFSSTEYRYEPVANASDTHYLSQYMSWSAHSRARLTANGAARYNGNEWDVWQAGGSATLEAIPTWMSFRMEAFEGGGQAVCDYTEVRAILYQRLFDILVLRSDYRHYRDRDDRKSHAYGIKWLFYPTPAFDVQLGYRYYTQNHGADFDTLTLGMGAIF